MNIQSLSIVVPNKRCINNCAFCVSKMHCDDISNLIDSTHTHFPSHKRDYIARMAFARDNGCNTVMLTGNSEPQQNRRFLEFFTEANNSLAMPFRWIEMQTTGVLLDQNYLDFLRNYVGVSTISISMASFSDAVNSYYCSLAKPVHLRELCATIKDMGFNLRLSVNLTDSFYDSYAFHPNTFFEDARDLFIPDQMTLRVLYNDGSDRPQAQWVRKHALPEEVVEDMIDFVREHGSPLEKLPYGRQKYSLYGMSLVIDDDCMSKTATEDYKYLILQPNCHLYSRWDDMASLIF